MGMRGVGRARRAAAAAVAAGATAAGVLVGLPASAETAAEAGMIDATPPGLGYATTVELTDGGLYVAGLAWPDAQLWYRKWHEDGDRVALGNTQLVAIPVLDFVDGLGADGDTAVWRDQYAGVLMARTDDGTTTPLGHLQPVNDYADGWMTGVDVVARADGNGAFSIVLEAVPPGEGVQAWDARTNGTEAVWRTYDGAAGSEWLHVAPLGADGLAAGSATAVAQAGLLGGELPTWIGPFDLADDLLAWSEDGDDLPAVVRWVDPSDPTAEPGEITAPTEVSALAVDGSRIAYSHDVGGGQTVVVDVADPTVPVATFPVLAHDLDLHGDLLAWASDDSVGVASIGDRELGVAPSFSDVTPQTAFVPDIDWLTLSGIASGYADGTFRPLAPVSRQAMAAFLYRAAGSPAWEAPATSPFADLGPSSEFYDEITWLADQGITQGYDGPAGSVLFRPTAPVSRQAMAAFLYRYAGVEADPSEVSPFVDVPTDHEFYAEIAWLADAGISTGSDWGDGRFAFLPGAAVSRQAMAAFLHRMDGLGAPA